MGYPLVLKVQTPEVLHKSDVGGVVLGLRSREAVAAATDQLARKMQAVGITLEQVLLQREIQGGIEALVGVTTDPTFGPLLVCGLGGVLVELIKDVSFRLTPVSDVDAAEMVSRLRSARLLEGYRGSPPGDRDALIAVHPADLGAGGARSRTARAGPESGQDSTARGGCDRSGRTHACGTRLADR